MRQRSLLHHWQLKQSAQGCFFFLRLHSGTYTTPLLSGSFRKAIFYRTFNNVSLLKDKTAEDHNQECCGSLFALFQNNRHETLVGITSKNRHCLEGTCITGRDPEI